MTILVYSHTFPAGLIAGRADQHTVHFTMPGERATQAAGERIGAAVAAYVGTSINAEGARYIKERILKADAVRKLENGTWAIDGRGWGSYGAEVVQA